MNPDHSACPDHFVGTETLRCDACGWNVATLSYDRDAVLASDVDHDHPAFSAVSYRDAVAIAARQADETGMPWSVLDPWGGAFYVFSADDAVALFPSSIVRTVGPVAS